MSHYVYAPPLGALTLRGPLPPRQTQAQRNAAALEQARRATPAQKRDALKLNRAKANAEFAKQGIGNLVEVLANGELKLKGPFSILDDFGRRMLNQQLPVLSVDASGKVSSKGVAPGAQIVDSMPLFTNEQKQQIKNAPFSFFAGVMDPVTDNIIGVTLQKVMDAGMTPAQRASKTAKDTGRLFVGGYVYDLTTFPFNLAALPVQAVGIDLSKVDLKRFNIALEQPGDELFEPVSRRQIKSLRTMIAFFVLFFKKWVELHAALVEAVRDFVVGEEKIVTEKTTGTEENTASTAYVVDRIPNIPENAIARGLFRREGPGVFAVQIPAAKGRGTTRYYVLSPKGNLDRAVEMQRQWDQKYEAYKNDKITNAAGVIFYGPRMTFLRAQGKTEAQARNIIASEDNFPKQFAETRNLPTQFRVLFDRPDLGGGLDAMNGPRPSDVWIRQLRNAEASARATRPTREMTTVKVDLGPIASGSLTTTELTPRVKLGGIVDGHYILSPGLSGEPATTASGIAISETGAITIGSDVVLIGAGVVCLAIAVSGTVAILILAGIFGWQPTKVGASKEGLEAEFSDPNAGAGTGTGTGDGTGTDAGAQSSSSEEPSGGTKGESGEPSGSEGASEGGFPLVPAALAAGVALLLLTRR